MKNSGSTKKASKPKRLRIPSNKVLVDKEMMELLYDGSLLQRIKDMDEKIFSNLQQLTAFPVGSYEHGMADGMILIQAIIKQINPVYPEFRKDNEDEHELKSK